MARCHTGSSQVPVLPAEEIVASDLLFSAPAYDFISIVTADNSYVTHSL